MSDTTIKKQDSFFVSHLTTSILVTLGLWVRKFSQFSQLGRYSKGKIVHLGHLTETVSLFVWLCVCVCPCDGTTMMIVIVHGYHSRHWSINQSLCVCESPSGNCIPSSSSSSDLIALETFSVVSADFWLTIESSSRKWVNELDLVLVNWRDYVIFASPKLNCADQLRLSPC